MAIRTVSPFDSVVRAEPRKVQPDAPAKKSSEREEVEISAAAVRLRADHDLINAVFGGVEVDITPIEGHEVFEAAGKTEYLESIEKPEDLSPEATAERILGGIKSYIYGAFKLANKDATAEDFDQFQADVMRGFEQGLGEAKTIIEGLSALTPELAEDVDQTEALVRQGLEDFFTTERERYAAVSAS